MTTNPTDRRVTRSVRLLQRAIMDLAREKHFDKITVQDIIDRANVGRTTFYAHFQSKEELFVSTHDLMLVVFSRSFFDRTGTWLPAPAPEFAAFLEHIQHSGNMNYYLTWGNKTGGVHPLIEDRTAELMNKYLHEVFKEQDSAIPFVILSQQIASSLVAMMSWWMQKKNPYSASEIASMLHEMNLSVLRAAIRPKA